MRCRVVRRGARWLRWSFYRVAVPRLLLFFSSPLEFCDLISQPGIAPHQGAEINDMNDPRSDVCGVEIVHPPLPDREVFVCGLRGSSRASNAIVSSTSRCSTSNR